MAARAAMLYAGITNPELATWMLGGQAGGTTIGAGQELFGGGPKKALDYLAQQGKGFVDSNNPFGENLSPADRIERGANLVLTLLGTAHGLKNPGETIPGKGFNWTKEAYAKVKTSIQNGTVFEDLIRARPDLLKYPKDVRNLLYQGAQRLQEKLRTGGPQEFSGVGDSSAPSPGQANHPSGDSSGLKPTFEEKRRYRGAAVKTDVDTNNHIYLTGEKVNSAKDLGEKVQIYRNPGYETLRYYFVKDGKIVGQNAYTAHDPTYSPIHETGRLNDLVADINREMKRLGADSVWVQHNHPSGNPEPSSMDWRFHSNLRRALGDKLKGHVIIDHDKYSYLDPKASERGDEQYFYRQNSGTDDLLRPSRQHPVVGQSGTADNIANLGFQVQGQKGWATLVGVGADGRVRGLMDVPEGLLRDTSAGGKLRTTATVRRFAKQVGAPDIYLFLDPETHIHADMTMKNYIGEAKRNGLIRDVYSTNGQKAFVNAQPDSAYRLGRALPGHPKKVQRVP